MLAGSALGSLWWGEFELILLDSLLQEEVKKRKNVEP